MGTCGVLMMRDDDRVALIFFLFLIGAVALGLGYLRLQ